MPQKPHLQYRPSMGPSPNTRFTKGAGLGGGVTCRASVGFGTLGPLAELSAGPPLPAGEDLRNWVGETAKKGLLGNMSAFGWVDPTSHTPTSSPWSPASSSEIVQNWLSEQSSSLFIIWSWVSVTKVGLSSVSKSSSVPFTAWTDFSCTGSIVIECPLPLLLSSFLPDDKAVVLTYDRLNLESLRFFMKNVFY